MEKLIIAISVLSFAGAVLFLITSGKSREDGPTFVPKIPVSKGMLHKIKTALRRAGYTNTTPEFAVTLVMAATLVVAILLVFLTKIIWVAIFAPFFTFVAGYLFLTFQRRKYLKKASGEIQPFLVRLVASLGAGVSPQNAFLQSMSKTKLMKESMKTQIDKLQTNEPLAAVLEDTIEVFPLRAWEQFCRNIIMGSQKGTNLEVVLQNSVSQLQDIIALNAELRADYSRIAKEQLVIIVICVGMITLLFLTAREMISPLFESVPGFIAFMISISMMLGGILLGQKNVNDIEERLDI